VPDATETPVAETEAAAPSEASTQSGSDTRTEVVAPESESGTVETTIEKGAEAFLKFIGSIEDPTVGSRVIEALKPEVREQAPIIKDLSGRAEQRGYQRAINDDALRGKDQEEHKQVIQRRDEAEKALNAADQLDPTAVTQHARALRTNAERAHDHEMKDVLFKVIKAHPIFKSIEEDDRAMSRLANVNGVELPGWFPEYLDTCLTKEHDLAFQAGLAEGQKRLKAEDKLDEALRGGQDGGTAPRLPGMAPGLPSSVDKLTLEQAVELEKSGELDKLLKRT
jgi:hypothetical protein